MSDLNALAPGTYVVIATYSGNSYYSGTADASARFTVVQADVVITESATPVTIAYGTQDTLAVAGLPTGATGTVTFMSGAATLCIASATRELPDVDDVGCGILLHHRDLFRRFQLQRRD